MELSREKKTETFVLDGTGYDFFVKHPNTDDKIKYLASIARKMDGKILSGLEEKFKAKFDAGCALITGFPEMNTDGKPQFEYEGKPISSDPKSENYIEDWRDLILPMFLNQIMVYATKVYDGIDVNKIRLDASAAIPESEELSDESPLESNSSQQ